MNNKDILRQINRKKTPRWIYFVAIGIVILVLAVSAIFLISKKDKETNTDDEIANIDTSLVDEGEEDPENVESEEETGVEVKVDELIVGSDRINAIDVSKWQGKINWNDVKESGIEVAFVRIGYRGENGTIYKDEHADYNIQQAEKAGILVGVYFFSTAVSEAEAIEEANWTKAAIKGYSISYPVVYDCEGYKNSGSRMYELTKEERTNFALAYLKTIKEAGYDAMFYTSLNEAKDSVDWDMAAIESAYKVWIAHYPALTYPNIDTPDYLGTLHAWQYTNKGSVNGITGNVDMVVCYFKNEKAKPKDKKARPEDAQAPKTEAEKQYTEVNEQVTAKEEVNLRESDTTYSNIVALLKNGTAVKRIGIGKNGWSKLEYNGQIVYAITSYLTTDLTQKEPIQQKPVETDIVAGNTFTPINDSVTAKEEVNLRALPNTDSEIIGKLYSGDFLARTATSNKGWSRLIYNGQTVYAVTSYLSNEVVQVQKPEQEPPTSSDGFSAVDEQVTAKAETNLRTAPSTDNSEVVYLLKNGEYVRRIGVHSNGWSKLEYNGQTVYAISSYLMN